MAEKQVFFITRQCQGTVTIKGTETGAVYKVGPRGCLVNWKDAPEIADRKTSLSRGGNTAIVFEALEARASANVASPDMLMSLGDARVALAKEKASSTRKRQREAKKREAAKPEKPVATYASHVGSSSTPVEKED